MPTFFNGQLLISPGTASMVDDSRMFVESFARDLYTPSDPKYSLTPDAVEVDEGGTVTFSFVAENVRDGTPFAWDTVGGLVEADFADGKTSGAFTVTGRSGSFSRVLAEDLSFEEGDEEFSVRVHAGTLFGPVVATAGPIKVFDTSREPATYAIAADSSGVRPGESASFHVVTTGVSQGTVLYWEKSYGTATAAHFSSPLSGSVAMDRGSASFSVTASEDVPSILTIAFRLLDAPGGAELAVSESIVLYPDPVVSPSSASVFEGTSQTFTVTDMSMADGELLYWTVDGDAADFVGGVQSGTIVFHGGTGAFTVSIAGDSLTEGDVCTLSIRRESTTGRVLTTCALTIVDTTAWDGGASVWDGGATVWDAVV